MLSTVFTNDIRQTLDQFRRSVDHLFDNFYGYPTDRPATGSSERNEWAFSPMLETGWNDNSLHLRAILPGVSQEDVNVSMQGNQLVIAGERKAPEGLAKNGFTHLSYGKFSTSVALPNGLDVEKVNCRLARRRPRYLDSRLRDDEAAPDPRRDGRLRAEGYQRLIAGAPTVVPAYKPRVVGGAGAVAARLHRPGRSPVSLCSSPAWTSMSAPAGNSSSWRSCARTPRTCARPSRTLRPPTISAACTNPTRSCPRRC